MISNDLLIRSREDWLVGRWASLRLLTESDIEGHSARADLAIFIATSWQQANDATKVKHFVSLSLKWGQSTHVMSQFLIAGVYNTLACAKAIQSSNVNIVHTFEKAIDIEDFTGLNTLASAGLRMREQLKTTQSELSFYFPPLEDEARTTKTKTIVSTSSIVKQESKKQIIVLGMHRSGTSCVTNLVKNMGAYFGHDKASTGQNEENPKGFWERRDMRHITDKLLFSVNADWSRVSDLNIKDIPRDVTLSTAQAFDLILNELNEKRVWVLKEPRLCLLLPLLRGRLKQPLAICVYRNPIEVAISLQKRNNFPLAFGLLLWEYYTLSMLKNTSDMNRVFISYNKLMANPIEGTSQLCKALNSAGAQLTQPKSTQLMDIIDSNLYRNKVESHSIEGLLTIGQYNLHKSIECASPNSFSVFSKTSRDHLRFFENNVLKETHEPLKLPKEYKGL